MKSIAKLIYASSDQSPDLIYATRFFVPDPCVYLEHRGKRTLVLSDLEVDRGRTSARVDEVVAQSVLAKEVEKELKRKPSGEEVMLRFLRKRRISKVRTPGDFPLRAARILEQGGVRVEPVDGLFYPERERKSEEELRAIRRAIGLAEKGLKRAEEVLAASRAGRDARLRWAGRILTSEKLRGEMEAAVVLAGGEVSHTIVAGGRQACDPHERGSGPLRAHELIILDIFPRDPGTGYYGDLTRTVVRGKADEARRRLWHTVRQGQKLALDGIRPGVFGRRLHEDVQAYFKNEGYPTEERDGRRVGFFHGTGHGMGLELHEAPRFAATRFKKGQVFTVEPGLYYPDIGGVRLEDDVVVTGRGIRILSRIGKRLEI